MAVSARPLPSTKLKLESFVNDPPSIVMGPLAKKTLSVSILIAPVALTVIAPVPVLNRPASVTLIVAAPVDAWPTMSIEAPFCVIDEPLPSTLTVPVVVPPPFRVT